MDSYQSETASLDSLDHDEEYLPKQDVDFYLKWYDCKSISLIVFKFSSILSFNIQTLAYIFLYIKIKIGVPILQIPMKCLKYLFHLPTDT